MGDITMTYSIIVEIDRESCLSHEEILGMGTAWDSGKAQRGGEILWEIAVSHRLLDSRAGQRD